MSSLLIKNIKTLVQAETTPRGVAKGADMARLPCLNDAWLLAEGDTIAAFGTMDTCPGRAGQLVDARGKMVFPAWCDSHTHLVFAASREEEFVDRIRGLSYEEIARRGGGILNSARRLAETPEAVLLESARQRLEEVICGGTGALEIKSGYGLSIESELKMLRVIRDLKAQSPIPIKATFLGAHAVPEIWRNNREGYIRLLTDELLPRVAAGGLADYCDVFCDRGFFTVEETDRILKVAGKLGLRARIHANELDNSGGVQVGVANNAISVDHLERIGDAEIACLQQSNTFPTLLPACAFFLGIPYAPARRLIDAGLPVVLASDYNPGSAPSGNMAFVVSLACIKMKMTPEEAINAATINGAHALELGHKYGSISPGKIANLFITKQLSSIAHLPYAFGSNPVEQLVLNGRLRHTASIPQ